MVCSKWHASFLCYSYLAFFFQSCRYRPYSSTDTTSAGQDQIFLWSITFWWRVHAFPKSMFTSLSVDEIFLMRYMNLEAFHLMCRWYHIILNMCTLFYLCWRRGKCLLLPAPGYAVGIQLGRAYLRKVGDNRPPPLKKKMKLEIEEKKINSPEEMVSKFPNNLSFYCELSFFKRVLFFKTVYKTVLDLTLRVA